MSGTLSDLFNWDSQYILYLYTIVTLEIDNFHRGLWVFKQNAFKNC